MPSFKFSKEEKLKSQKVIQQLFEKRMSIHIFPLRLIWGSIDPRISKYPAQFAVTVPKRSFPRAVDRNRIKRVIREAYRLGKPTLYEQLLPFGQQYGLMFIYTGKKQPTLEELQHSVKRIRKKIVSHLTEEKGLSTVIKEETKATMEPVQSTTQNDGESSNKENVSDIPLIKKRKRINK